MRMSTSRTRLAAAVVAAVAVIGALAVVLVALSGDASSTASPGETSTAAATSTASSTPSPTPEASPAPIKHAGILDGFPMSDEEWDARKDHSPIAVMVDNTTGAYPHSGLDRADLVYEAFVEGGITRLMAVYWRQDAGKIMPVRSARTPFVIWANELLAMYGHAGGATTDNEANAIGQIVEWGVRDLNAFSPVSGNYYYRDNSRFGPYNLATSTSYLREAAGQLGFDGPPSVASWKFLEPGTPLPPGAPAGGVEVDFQGRLYAWQYIQWKWDPAFKRYLRFQFGGPHLDSESGQQLAFATVVVMKVPGSVVDEAGHVVLQQTGSGESTVFTGGQAYPGVWTKESRDSRTRFFNVVGDEIVMERGPVFVEVIGEQSRFAVVAAPGDLPPLPEYVPPPPGSAPGDSTDEPGTGTEPEPSATATTAVPSPTVRATGTPGIGATPSPSSPASATPGVTATAAPSRAATATATFFP